MLDVTIMGLRIRTGREKQGLTQEQLAERLHVTKQAVSNWERGKNIPEESIRETVESILKIKLRSGKRSNGSSTIISDLKPLCEINDMDEMISSLDLIVDSVEVSGYERVVRKLLFMSLVVISSYTIYYEHHHRGFYSSDDNPLDWYVLAANLRDFVNAQDFWPMDKFPFGSHGLLAKKAEKMAYTISGELFEETEESLGFYEDIGFYGEKYAYILADLLPHSNTDLMVCYKTAVWEVVELFDQI